MAIASRFFLPARFGFLKWGIGLVGAFAVAYGGFTGAFFYAEPGYKYHVRTIFGDEKMVRDVGYNTKLWGQVNSWKNAMSVQATWNGAGNLSAERDGRSGEVSANLAPQTLVFLDQVDAAVHRDRPLSTARGRGELPAPRPAVPHAGEPSQNRADPGVPGDTGRKRLAHGCRRILLGRPHRIQFGIPGPDAEWHLPGETA